jgi:putative Ca2+/H+ antiporter (TMEM165/GDT1 family)
VDVLLLSFIAAGLAEFGDKTQLLVIALAVRYRQPLPVLAGVAVGALANALLAGFGGTLIHGLITLRATSLLVALALVFAGVAGLLRNQAPEFGTDWRTGAFLTSAGAFFLVEFGDKTQFLTLALAAQYDSLFLAAGGATAGVIAANAPAALLGDTMRAALPMKGIRIAAAILFLLCGLIVAISALRLV